MYRKRSSILAIKFISSSVSRVSPSPTYSRSSQNALLNSIKVSHLTRPRRRRSFSVAAQRSDFSPDSEPVGLYQRDPSGFDGRNSLYPQQNPDGYQSGNIGEVQQWNSNGFRGGESAIGSYRRDPFGVDRGSSTSLQPNLNGFSRGSLDGRQRCDLGAFRQPNSNDGYQRNNLGEAQHWNSNGFYGENPNGHFNQVTTFSIQSKLSEFPREGSRTGGQFNHMNYYQNMGADADGLYRERTGDFRKINRSPDRNSTGNSVEAFQQKRGALCDGSRASDGHSYENQSVIFYENQISGNSLGKQTGNSLETFQQNSTGVSRVGDEYPYENQSAFFGENYINRNSFMNHSRNSVQSSQQNPRVFSGGSRRGDEYPYDNQSAFFRENHINRNSSRNRTGNSVESSQQNSRVLSGGSRIGDEYPYENQSGLFRGNQISRNSFKNHTGNSVESSQQNPNVLSGGSKVGDGYPYENQSGFFRENHIEVHKHPTGHNPDPRRHYSVNPGQLYQNSYAHGENPFPYGLQNLIESPRTSSAKCDNELFPGGSPGSGEMISYEGTLNKLEEFCKEGKLKEAIAVMAVFEKAGMVIDLSIYLKLVQACGEAKSLEKARVVHDYLSRRLGAVEVWVHNKILDMYSKCGSMGDAYQFFEKMPCRNLTSWETMIRGLSDNGLGEEAINLFTQFKNIGMKPDGALFAAVFYTCGVLGAVDQGMLYYESMKVEFGIVPVMEHYVSIVDMFGRSGHLDEALEFIEAMPIKPSVNVWETLMNFCRVNGYTELGDRCAEIVEQLDSSRLTDQSRMGLVPINTLEITNEKEMKDNSDIAAGKHQMQPYVAGRPENYMIYEKIKCLAQHMKEAGYVPNAAVTLHDVDLESREEALLYHSERLALVHGLMTSSVEAPIRIIKNLRVCSDCHNALKIMSKLTGRLIIARDTKRFHHFQNGVCSCNDFW